MLHNPSLCARNPILCNIIQYYVIFVQMMVHTRLLNDDKAVVVGDSG